MLWLILAIAVLFIVFVSVLTVATMAIYLVLLLIAVTLAGAVGFYAMLAITDNQYFALAGAMGLGLCTLLWMVIRSGIWETKK